MDATKRTLKDLSFLSSEGKENILDLIDKASTSLGSALIKSLLTNSPATLETLLAQQSAVRFWHTHAGLWPKEITNGTIVMLEKFFESADSYAAHPGGFSLFGGKQFQKLFNRNEYHFTQFSLSHLCDFLKGCFSFLQVEKQSDCPPILQEKLGQMRQLLDHPLCTQIASLDKEAPFKEITQLSFRARRELKSTIRQLLDLFTELDAWKGLADATRELDWVFPEITAENDTCLSIIGLFHPLLQQAISYDLHFEKGSNFMVLTGANMSGKTTLIRALGVATILAKIGMGVPAKSFRCSFLKGVRTNMHVEDDLLKGESFFLAEVKTIRQTALAIAGAEPQLVLMDELFKGTNVHDAYECTKAIVEGMLKHPQHIMILSTHLHEVAHHFAGQKVLSFYRFNTGLAADGSFTFNYKLVPGISDERIGYRILQQEGIIDILNQSH